MGYHNKIEFSISGSTGRWGDHLTVKVEEKYGDVFLEIGDEYQKDEGYAKVKITPKQAKRLGTALKAAADNAQGEDD